MFHTISYATLRGWQGRYKNWRLQDTREHEGAAMRSHVVRLRFATPHAQLPFFIIFCRSSPTMQAPAPSTRLLSAIAMPAQQKLSRHVPSKSYLQEPAPRSSDEYDHPLRTTSFRSASLQQLSPSKFGETKSYRFLFRTPSASNRPLGSSTTRHRSGSQPGATKTSQSMHLRKKLDE